MHKCIVFFYFQTLPVHLYDLLEQSMPFYKMLRSKTRKTVQTSPIRPALPDPPLPVPENEKILVWVGDELVPRSDAKVLLKPLCRLHHSFLLGCGGGVGAIL
jgi:hypothetical protein